MSGSMKIEHAQHMYNLMLAHKVTVYEISVMSDKYYIPSSLLFFKAWSQLGIGGIDIFHTVIVMNPYHNYCPLNH